MNTDQLIAQYFSNTLSPEMQKEFDHLMATDSDFAKDVAFQKNLKTVIKKEEQILLKQQLASFDDTTIKPSKNYIKWFVAASIIALLAIPSIWYFGNTSIDTDELFAANFEPYRNVVQPIVRGEVSEDLKTKAFTAYETKNFEEALSHFNELLSESTSEAVLFYKANVLLELNKTEDAIVILEQNLKTTDTLNDKTQWYLALAYIKINEIDKARAQLNVLSTSPSTFKKDAIKQLLKKLD